MPHHSGRPSRRGPTPRALRALGPLLVAFFAVVVAAGPVAAQVPPLPPGAEANVGLSVSPTSAQIERGECHSFQVRVQNTGQPALAEIEDEVAVSVSQPSAGWTTALDPSAPFQLGRGEERLVSVRLCATEDVARGSTGRTTLTAELRPVAPPGSEPVTATVPLTATVPEGGLVDLGNVPPFVLWIALAAVGVLLATAILARRRPGAAVSLECREPSKEVPAGRGTSFPVRIANEGRSRDVVSLTTSPVPQGWDTFLPLVDVPLEPGEEQTVWISVKSPDDARPGDHVAVKVLARSSAAGGEQASLDLLTTVSATGAESAWGGGISTGGIGDEERSVYGPESASGAKGGGAERGVAIKRRRS